MNEEWVRLMPENFRHVDAPDVLATFAGFTQMMDRMHALPVCVTPSVEFAHRKSARWTGDEDDKMLELYAQGLSYRAIGEGLGRSYEGVRHRLYFLGYGKP